MTGRLPKISVILPVYNGERFLREALESIFAQDYSPFEVLAVDDGSTDGSAALIASAFPSVRCLRRPHAGLSAARNAGIAEAEGEWVAFLDCDDTWAPGKLRREAEYLQAHPEKDAVFGHIRQFFSPEEGSKTREAYRIDREVLPGVHPDTMLASLAAVRRVGPFNPEISVGEFLDWFARSQEAGFAYEVLPDVLAFRRIHGDNMSITEGRTANREYARLLKAALDRRRK